MKCRQWILDQEAVTSVIPGFKTVAQVMDNLEAEKVPSFTTEELDRLAAFYDEKVHAHIRGVY